MSLDLDRKVDLETPEQVTISLPLAGVGSRMAAYGLDLVIRLALSLLIAIPAIFVVVNFPGLGSHALGGAVIGYFCLHFGYYVYFEVVHRGQTPGKRRMGLRTVKLSGAPVDFAASALRNILRVVDWLPGFYGIGVVCMFSTTLEQRLGDLTAGTVVVREKLIGSALDQPVEPGDDYAETCRQLQLVHPDRIQPNLGKDEAQALARLLGRLPGVDADAGQRLMERLVHRLRGKVADPDGVLLHCFDRQDTRELALRFLLQRTVRARAK